MKKKILRTLAALPLAIAPLALVSGCEDGPFDSDPAEDIEDAAEDTGDAVGDAVN